MNGDIAGVKEYAQAQVYSRMYRFAYVGIHLMNGGNAKRAELINEINSLDAPQETKKFMSDAVQDAFNRKPKRLNYFYGC